MMSMINSIVPTLSYLINMVDRLFTIFASYLGFDLDQIYDDFKTQIESTTEETDA